MQHTETKSTSPLLFFFHVNIKGSQVYFELSGKHPELQRYQEDWFCCSILQPSKSCARNCTQFKPHQQLAETNATSRLSCCHFITGATQPKKYIYGSMLYIEQPFLIPWPPRDGWLDYISRAMERAGTDMFRQIQGRHFLALACCTVKAAEVSRHW
jgi:hypothetical protein